MCAKNFPGSKRRFFVFVTITLLTQVRRDGWNERAEITGPAACDNQDMSSKELDRLPIRELERLRANCLRGSINEELITPILEAKRRKADSRRVWIVAIMGSAVAVLGLVVSYLRH
jgi:hypothetical protein